MISDFWRYFLPRWVNVFLLWFLVGEATGFGKGIYDWAIEKLIPNSSLNRYLQFSANSRSLPLYWPKISKKSNEAQTYVYYTAIQPAEAAKNSHLLEKRNFKRRAQNGDKFATG